MPDACQIVWGTAGTPGYEETSHQRSTPLPPQVSPSTSPRSPQLPELRLDRLGERLAHSPAPATNSAAVPAPFPLYFLCSHGVGRAGLPSGRGSPRGARPQTSASGQVLTPGSLLWRSLGLGAGRCAECPEDHARDNEDGQRHRLRQQIGPALAVVPAVRLEVQLNQSKGAPGTSSCTDANRISSVSTIVIGQAAGAR